MKAPPPFSPRYFVLQSEPQLRRLCAVVEAAWGGYADAGRPLEVSVGEWRARRSGSQNRFYWLRLQQIADQVWLTEPATLRRRRYSTESWHEAMAGKFIGWEDLPGGGRRALSTSSLSVEEFRDYIAQVEAHAAAELCVTFDDN